MNPDASIRKTWRGAADCGLSARTAGSASAAAATSFIAILRGGADLTRRRAFALALTAGTMRRLRHDADLLGAPAGLRHRPVDIAARAVRTLAPACGPKVQIHPGMPERTAPAVAGRHHLADLY